MHGWELLRDIMVLLGAALVVGALFERLGLSAIVGYLISGTLVGPSVFGWVADSEGSITVLAELGVTLLLFSIGLEISWRRFRSLGRMAAIGGPLQIIITMALAAGIAMAFGASAPLALTIGGMVALSSTATVLRLLQDRAEVDSQHGRVAFGILIVQDIAVVPLILMVTFLSTEGGAAAVLRELASTTGAAVGLVVALVLIGTFVLPRLLGLETMRRNRELPVILAILAWLASTWAAHEVKLSPALGAFVAGMIVAESPFAAQIRADTAALRIIFVTLFFGSVGLIADMNWLFEGVHALQVGALVLAIIVGKAAIIWIIVRLLGRSHQNAITSGLLLGQIGEFSFAMGAVAASQGLIDRDGDVYQLLISATLLTLILTPLLAAKASSIAAALGRILARFGIDDVAAQPKGETAHAWVDHVVVVGFGPAGCGAVEALSVAKLKTIVVDLNPTVLTRAKERGVIGMIGNPAQPEILERLHIEHAHALVITIPDHHVTIQIVQQARLHAPKLRIIARVRYQVYAEEVRRAGADVLVDEEDATGKLLGAFVLRETVLREEFLKASETATRY